MRTKKPLATEHTTTTLWCSYYTEPGLTRLLAEAAVQAAQAHTSLSAWRQQYRAAQQTKAERVLQDMQWQAFID